MEIIAAAADARGDLHGSAALLGFGPCGLPLLDNLLAHLLLLDPEELQHAVPPIPGGEHHLEHEQHQAALVELVCLRWELGPIAVREGTRRPAERLRHCV